MSELLKIVLSLSLSGTLLFFIVLALKPLYKNKLSKRWQYYVWLIVIVRMLIPFTPETTLVGSTFQHLENINVATINDTQTNWDSDESDMLPNGQPQAPQPNMETVPSISMQAIFSKAYENLWILWVAIAFALLIRKITIYQSFVRFVKAGRTEVADIEILNMLADVGETIGVKRPVELFINPLISSPMLLGFFRPYIILPSIEIERTELVYIMRHELTHYKYLDMFYKWLVQLTVCLHWFNPFAYLLAKEINKCCELSCDEAIIRTMDKGEKKAYGDTLLNSLQRIGNYNDKLATVTLAESAEQLKERLDAIMKYRKLSRLTTAISIALACTLCFGATVAGAYTTNPGQGDYATTPPTIPPFKESSQYVTKQGVSVSSYNIIKYIEENKKVNVFIEFVNNTSENIDLLYFNYEAFDSEGARILTSQDNTNDLGEILEAGKTIRVYLTLPESLSTIKMSITKYQTQDGQLISIPKGTDNLYKLDFLSAPSLGKATDIKLENYEFFKIEETPAIKATFQNNTDIDISSVNVRIKFLNFSNSLHDYTAKIEIKAGESATHSGWGLVNGVTSIEVGIVSYVTTDGTLHQINSDDIAWLQLSLR